MTTPATESLLRIVRRPFTGYDGTVKQMIAERVIACEANRLRRNKFELVRCSRVATVFAQGKAYCFNHGKHYRDSSDYARIRATHHTD